MPCRVAGRCMVYPNCAPSNWPSKRSTPQAGFLSVALPTGSRPSPMTTRPIPPRRPMWRANCSTATASKSCWATAARPRGAQGRLSSGAGVRWCRWGRQGGPVACVGGGEEGLMGVGTAGARDITAAGNPNVFRTRPPGDYTGAAAGRYLYDKGVRTLGILGVRDVALFTQYREALIKSFEQAGGKVVALETFGGHDRDMTPQLTKLNRLDPDAVFISGYVEQAAFAYRQFKEIGMKMPRYGFSGGSERQFLKVASSEQMEGVTDLLSVEFSVQALGSENAKRFADAYKKKYGEEPTPNTAYTYDQVYVLRDALKSAQSTSDVKKLIAALRGLPVPKEVLLKYQPIDGKMFDGNGQAYISNGAFQWKQGQWQFLGELPSDAKAYSAYLRSLRK